MSVAIDFTASNGPLHDLNDNLDVMNDYELALTQVGKILSPYSYRG